MTRKLKHHKMANILYYTIRRALRWHMYGCIIESESYLNDTFEGNL